MASRGDAAQALSRDGARRQIERVLREAVIEALRPIDLVLLRAVVLQGNDGGDPAIILICDSVGQLDLGWIEASDAPIAWRAAAYRALEKTLGCVLPIFGYQDLLDEFARYYWDGETDDEAALHALVCWHGIDPEDREQYSLPSEMNAKRPDWMLNANAGRRATLPKGLVHALDLLTRTHKKFRRVSNEQNAWTFDLDVINDYLPDFEEASSLPPLTLVPVEQFAREVDDLAQYGMELGFMDVAGICPLPDVGSVDNWFASLRLGVRFLEAVQALIRLDPTIL